MSIRKGDKLITNLYDTILDKVIGNVLLSFFAGSASQAWDSLLTLYDVLDDEVQKEVKSLVDEVQLHINREMAKRGYAQSDVLQKQRILREYVNIQKHVLFNKIIRLLIKHGYLQRSWSGITKEDLERLESKNES